MKNLFKLFVPAVIAAAAFTACQEEMPVPAQQGEIQIKVTAVPQALAGVDTRTYIDNTNTILWGTGEYMKLAVQAGDAAPVFANSSDASAGLFDGKPTATFSFSVTGITGSCKYMGLYPASAAATSSNTNPANYKVNLPAIQNATASSYDPAAYIMVTKPETFNDVTTEWMASYRRATALNKITLKNLPSGVSIKRVVITAPNKQLAGGRHIDLTTGESTDIYSNESTIEVKYATALSGTNVDVWFTSWDVEVAEGEKLKIDAYTTDQKCYTKEITVPAGKTIKFQEGYLNTLGASFSGITPAVVTELEAGSYVVLAKDGSNYHALKAEKEDGKERLLSVDYTGNLTSYAGSADIIWNLTKSGDSYIFENSSKYLGYQGSNNESYWLEAGESWTTDNYLLDITAQETAGQYYVTVHSNSSRYLSKNLSSAYFAFYGNTSQKADIVFIPATVDMRTAVTLSFNEESMSATSSNYGSFNGQTVIADPDVTAVTGNISYAMTGDAIGSINASTGAVTLNGSVGIATVTASFTGDETYMSAEASYTVSVISSTGPHYNLVSTLEGVVAGDYVITWDNSLYLPNTTAASNPDVGNGIVVSGSMLSNTVTEEMVWTFEGDNTNGFIVKSGTNRLISSNKAQGISVATSGSTTWTVSIDDTYGMLLHGNEGGSRYLAVYNNTDWRYYTKGSDYKGKMRLYKLEDNRTPINLSFANASYSFDESNYDLFTGQTATSNPTVSGITYSLSGDAIGSITPSTGAVVLNGTAGEATVTASFAGDGSYKPATASYTITVTAPANDGSLEHPYTASEARSLALDGDTGSYYISGTVTKIQNQYSASYGTANFWIDENGTTQNVFEAYKIKYFGNVNWVEGNAQINVNDEVIVYGTLTTYTPENGNTTTPETSSGYLVSLNGKTKGLTLAVPTVTTNTANSAKEITVAWTAATGTDSAVSYVVTCGTQSYNATAAGNHTFTMSDYGTYNVSVEASASDAISATVTSSASLADPNAGTPTVYTIQWGADYNGSSVSSYTATWDATKDGFKVNMANFNNNNNGWSVVKCGRKNTASVATIITDSAIPEAIKTVTITIDALTVSNINSITLYVSNSKTSGWTSAGTFTKATGNQSVTIANPAANRYYKLEFDCASGSSNGLLTLSKAQFSTN